MTSTRGSVRVEVRIRRPAEEVWAMVGSPARLPEWYASIKSVLVEGQSRIVTSAGGREFVEQLLTVDNLQRRLQYRIVEPVLREHLATIDVHDLEENSCLVVYSCDADPAAFALSFGGAAADGLENLRARLERDVA